MRSRNTKNELFFFRRSATFSKGVSLFENRRLRLNEELLWGDQDPGKLPPPRSLGARPESHFEKMARSETVVKHDIVLTYDVSENHSR